MCAVVSRQRYVNQALIVPMQCLIFRVVLYSCRLGYKRQGQGFDCQKTYMLIKCMPWMHSKSIWIKASVKWVNAGTLLLCGMKPTLVYPPGLYMSSIPQLLVRFSPAHPQISQTESLVNTVPADVLLNAYILSLGIVKRPLLENVSPWNVLAAVCNGFNSIVSPCWLLGH